MLLRTSLAWMVLAGSLFAAQNVVVVVDDSGSMADRMRHERTRKIDAAKRSLAVVLEKLPADAEVGVLALNGGWIIPLQKVDPAQVVRRINELRARGGTPLGTRMKEATDELLAKREQEIYDDYRLLVVTDGEASDQDVLDSVLPDIMSRGLLIDVIGVDMEAAHSLATQVHHYRRADDPDSLEEAIASALAETDESAIIGGDSDFELLEGLPVDMAPVVITALTNRNNEPIGGAAFDSAGFDGGFRPATPSVATGFALAAFFCMGVVFFFVAALSYMLRAVIRPRR